MPDKNSDAVSPATKRAAALHRWSLKQYLGWWSDRFVRSSRFRSDDECGIELKDRRPPDAQLFAELASLAGVPVTGGEKLRQGVSFELDRIWLRLRLTTVMSGGVEVDESGGLRRPLTQLRRLERLLSDLDETLRNLDPMTLRFLEAETAAIHSLDAGPARLIAALAKASSATQRHLRLSTREPRGRRGRWAWYWSGFSDAFHVEYNYTSFTLRLLLDGRAAGGRLTLDKNSGKGTLPEALRLLSPYLPSGFIPKALPLSTLAQIKAVEKKLAAIDWRPKWAKAGSGPA
jgi:hypothetical protein